MIKIEIAPTEAEEFLDIIDGLVREGGVTSAIKLAPLAQALKAGIEDFRSAETPTFEAFTDDIMMQPDSKAVPIIDATDDFAN